MYIYTYYRRRYDVLIYRYAQIREEVECQVRLANAMWRLATMSADWTDNYHGQSIFFAEHEAVRKKKPIKERMSAFVTYVYRNEQRVDNK